MKKGLFIFLAVAFLALPATVSFSQEEGAGTPPARQGQGPGPGGMMRDPRMGRMPEGMFGAPRMAGFRRMQMLRMMQNNPKLAGLLMQMRGELMMKQGEVLMKYGKQIENLPPSTPPVKRRE